MGAFDEYSDRYAFARMTRRDGILELTLHTDGGPLIYSASIQRELGAALTGIALDSGNKVLILTGCGDKFCADFDLASFERIGALRSPQGWDEVMRNERRILAALMDIPIPVIAAVNGPATVHSQLAVLSDVVLAAETAYFQDTSHFSVGVVPGDGEHVTWLALLGVNRGRYFLLTEQKLSAAEAMALGVVNEVLAPERLLPRAWELAGKMATLPPLTLRYARTVLTSRLRRELDDGLVYGLALAGLSAIDLVNNRTKSSE
ncbi:MAG: enoyl-CoA hydratase/isomerase family protein [Candidatus Binataceae bacterium]